MKAVIYARYSSDNQREESIEGQIRECKSYAEKQGITVLTSYIDRALSAKTDNRPDFQRMIKDSSKKLFDIVLVWKLDRFARNRYDSAHYKAVLRKNGVKVVSATEPISEDSTGILLESLLEGYAEFYSVELAEKVKRGQDENALKCKNNGGSVPYGYFINSEHKFEINPEEAVIVKEIFKRYSEGERIIDIANSLNERGLKTNRNKPFIKSFFTRLLKNRRYIGEYRYREVLVENGIPAIIDKDLFEQVQMRLKKNKHAPATAKANREEPYLLTTKLFCGDCGQAMVGESGKSSNGNIHYYYKCRSAKQKTGCKRRAIKKQLIEDTVIMRTIEILYDEKMLDNLSEQAVNLLKKESPLLPQLKKQLAETEKGIENILNAIQQGILSVVPLRKPIVLLRSRPIAERPFGGCNGFAGNCRIRAHIFAVCSGEDKCVEYTAVKIKRIYTRLRFPYIGSARICGIEEERVPLCAVENGNVYIRVISVGVAAVSVPKHKTFAHLIYGVHSSAEAVYDLVGRNSVRNFNLFHGTVLEAEIYFRRGKRETFLFAFIKRRKLPRLPVCFKNGGHAAFGSHTYFPLGNILVGYCRNRFG